jgi:GT2 family glycosyltransferase
MSARDVTFQQVFTPERLASIPVKASVAVRFSVIIVNYNGRDHIGKCLDSLTETLPYDSEIILVDNHSDDDSANYIKTYYPNVTVVHNPENNGFGQGNNLGVSHSRGEYLVFLNPDTCVSEGWLENMLEVLDSSPEIGMVTPKILLMDEPELINTCGNDMHYTGLTLCRGARARADQYNEQAEVSAVSGAAFIMRKSVFTEVGGFDPFMFMYMDDADLSLRVRQAGYKCVYTPKSIVHHDYILTFGPRKTYYQERNRYLMLLKNWQWRTLLLMLPALLFAEVISWGFVLVKERRNLMNKPRAYWDTLREWRKIRAWRRTMSPHTRVSDRELLRGMTYRMDFEQTGADMVSRAAHLVFDPVFYLLHRFLLLIRW